MSHYNKPPITEAALEFRFADSFSHETTEKAARKIKSEYAQSDQDKRFGISVDVGKEKSDLVPKSTGVRLTSSDRADITVFQTNAFVCARLAPYCGWEAFIGRAKRDWEVWRKIAGVTKLSRVGLRYINRLDIPAPDKKIQVRDYLNVWPHFPEGSWGAFSDFSFHAVRPLGVDELGVRVYSGTVDAPLVGRLSLALDLDLFRESALPIRDDVLWELLERMREHKNQLFELCITDSARELFNQ